MILEYEVEIIIENFSDKYLEEIMKLEEEWVKENITYGIMQNEKKIPEIE